jgi:hypothetical protein
MTLPNSPNSISIFQINEELARTGTTANTSLQSLSNGSYVTINTNSASRPDGASPHAMSEFHSYNHYATGSPTLNSVSSFTYTTPDCGVFWQVQVGWTTSNQSDTTHKIVIRDFYTNGVLADNLTTASSSEIFTTDADGDPFSTLYTSYFRAKVQLVLKSDSSVVTELTTTELSVSYGDDC